MASTVTTAGSDLHDVLEALRNARALPGSAHVLASPSLLGPVVESLQQLEQQVGGLADACANALQSLNDAEDWLRGVLDPIESSLQDKLETFSDRGERLSSTDLPELAEAATDALGNCEQRLTEALGSKHERVIDDFDRAFGSARRALSDELADGAARLSKDAGDRLQDVGRAATDAFEQRVAAQARQTVEQAVTKMGSEIAENLVLSQASMAIVGALGPMLPQLIALRAAVTVIKTALKIARGGF